MEVSCAIALSIMQDRLLLELLRRRPLPPRLQWHALILCLSSVASIDSTAIQMLKDLAHECHATGVMFLLAAPNADVEAAIATSGLGDVLGGSHKFVFTRVHDAVRALLLRTVTEADLPSQLVIPAVTAPLVTSASARSGDGGWIRRIRAWVGSRASRRVPLADQADSDVLDTTRTSRATRLHV